MWKFLAILASIAAIMFVFFGRKERSNDEIETLVKCDLCGTYVTKKEAIASGGKTFCSKKCAMEAKNDYDRR
ncbi:MAG: hypothetical protein LBQ52_06485 [Helicobacteraceae bacterium]|jgi:formylmethanofuran dehydrogenase subunit E|nr:hypothetical protein [Helicobacteraceae bacterium]